MKILKLITWPGDLALKFLIWRDRIGCKSGIFNFFCFYILTIPSIFAIIILLIADLIDDTFTYIGIVLKWIKKFLI